MNTWTDYFDEIYLVALPERLDQAIKELKKYNIPFKIFDADKQPGNGLYGLLRTMTELFRLNQDKKRILVFEDDVDFVQDPNMYMPACVEQLEKLQRWDLFYLGINMDNDNNLFSHFTDKNILPVKFGYSTHAVAYSSHAIQELYRVYSSMAFYPTPTDKIIAAHLQPQGHCYCSYPLLATQRDGFSYIENKSSTYEYIKSRFEHSVSHLLTAKSGTNE
jgi:GR25 family glycosyltransferase involved in LPS biosynthesis